VYYLMLAKRKDALVVTGLPESLGEIFSPDQPIEDPSALFGRKEELRELMISFNMSLATVPVIVGPPGIGKSSLFAMLHQTLAGDLTILESNALSAYQPQPKRRLVIIQRCSRTMMTETALSSAITDNIARGVVEKSKGRKFKLRDFELGGSVNFLSAKASWERTEDKKAGDLPDRFNAIIAEGDADEIVVLLDECEQLPWIERLLDWTRDFSLSGTRFCVAVRDHAAHRLTSAQHGDYRWPRRIAVRPLTDTEITALFYRAAQFLHSYGVNWSINPEALNYVALHSGGEPWYLQMIGSELIADPNIDILSRIAAGHGPINVSVVRLDVVNAERRVLENRLLGLHAQRYNDLVARAPKREELLRSLAKFPAGVIPADYVSDIQKFRIPGMKRVIDSLISEPDPVIIRVANGRAWQFSDHQFKVYCRLIEPLHPSSEVFASSHAEAWRESH
jgi:hypothetical protein